MTSNKVTLKRDSTKLIGNWHMQKILKKKAHSLLSHEDTKTLSLKPQWVNILKASNRLTWGNMKAFSLPWVPKQWLGFLSQWHWITDPFILRYLQIGKKNKNKIKKEWMLPSYNITCFWTSRCNVPKLKAIRLWHTVRILLKKNSAFKICNLQDSFSMILVTLLAYFLRTLVCPCGIFIL